MHNRIATYAILTVILFCGALFGNEIQYHIPPVIAGLWMSLGIAWWLAPIPGWAHDAVESAQWFVTLAWCALLCWPALAVAVKPGLARRRWFFVVLVAHLGFLVFLMVQGYEVYRAAIHPGGV